MFTHDQSHETMRCREAREKLIELADGTLDSREHETLYQHLNQCSRCAQLAIAEQSLTRDLEQIRHAEPSCIMTVGQVRERISIREESEKTINVGVRIMRQVSETVYRQPRLSIASAVMSVLLLASILVPVRTEHAIEYEVTFAAPAGGLILNEQNAEKMLVALNMDDARVEVRKSPVGTEYKIAPLADSAKVRRLMAALDSQGGLKVRSEVESTKSDSRTVWQLLLDDDQPAETYPPPQNAQAPKDARVINLNDEFKGDFTLWMPVGDQPDDSLRGLLLNRQGDKTNIQFVGLPTDRGTNDCGWNQFLNNSVMHTQTPDGEQATFYLYEIEDVRKLEKMGYNFVTMKWDKPRQVPIPGMGPKLNEIIPNPFRDAAMIEFMIPQAYEVRLQVLEEYGREVCTLRDCIVLAGIYSVVWDGLDTDGNQVEPGTYLCRLIAGDYLETQEIVLDR